MARMLDDIRRFYGDPRSSGADAETASASAPSRKKSARRRNRGSAGKAPADAEGDSEFKIEVRFLGGLTPAQQDAFGTAAARWETVITAALPAVDLGDGTTEGVRIDASGVAIDDVGGILGQAGPTFLRPMSAGGLPAAGMMQFDTADLGQMEINGTLLDVITHEMGHVLGLGTLWGRRDLLVGCGSPPSADPIYVGENAMREFAELSGSEEPVPVANTGGSGTRCGHWREALFGNELMTGFIAMRDNPLSRLTVGSLDDLGYEVDYDRADEYELPSFRELVMMGIFGEGQAQVCRMCGIGGVMPEPVVLGESDLVG